MSVCVDTRYKLKDVVSLEIFLWKSLENRYTFVVVMMKDQVSYF